MSNSKTATSKGSNPRRSFIKRVLAAGAAVSASGAFVSRAAAGATQARGIVALDHVAIPIQNVEEMVSFYRALGFVVRENGRVNLEISVSQRCCPPQYLAEIRDRIIALLGEVSL